MAIETEKKYRLTDGQFAEIRNSLAEIGAQFRGVDFEENTIYRGGALDAANAALRVRKTEHKTILTYKKRLENDFAVKRQIEHETEVSDLAAITEIIECLGFVPAIIYEKRRQTWDFKTVEIVLDELPFGLFMEIEGSLTAIAEAEMMLGAEDFAVEHKTYPRLTAEHGSRCDEVFAARFKAKKS